MNLTIGFKVVDCFYCDFQFALPNSFILRRQEDHASFFCPTCGKPMYWPGLSEAERLKLQLENAQNEVGAMYRSNIALKGHLTRKKKQLGD